MEIGMNDYQVRANETAMYRGAMPTPIFRLAYVVLGLTDEAGVVANKVKKIMRDEGGLMSAEACAEIADELGDVLWYLAQTCSELDVTLAEVAKRNNAKLKARRDVDTIKGAGDGR